jgi:hypothetical protein
VAFAEAQQQFNANLKKIIVVEDDLEFPALTADGYRRQPAVIDEYVAAEWVQFVGVVLTGRTEQSVSR